MNLDDFREFISGRRWQFAKTMPEQPHEYTNREWGDEESFEAAVTFLRESGQKRRYGKAYYVYLDVDGWSYWTMGWPVGQTILMNRAKIADLAAPPGAGRSPTTV